MLREGVQAPAVALPGYVDGERRRVDLGEHLGEGIVVLAFYPADFSPACSMQTADLGDLDLFTMQKDVEVFAVSPDSTYSHESFADRYSLRVPLLSDREREATRAYGVELETETGERLCQRAVFVVDHHGEVRYAWATDDLGETVDVDPVKRAVADIGGDETALERYRAGHERYVEGRRAFEAAMADYRGREWVPAQESFADAAPAFTAAADRFDTASRFAETEALAAAADDGEEKADTLAHAADWLGDSADALGSGRGDQGIEYREDAERLLKAAGDLPDPPGPGRFALTGDGVEADAALRPDEDESDDDSHAWVADDYVDTDLGIDDAALDAAVAGETNDGVGDDAAAGDLEVDVDAVEAAGEDRGGAGTTDSSESETPFVRGGSGAGDPAESASNESSEEVGELDLTDPTEDENEDEDEDDRADWDVPGR